MAIPQQAFQAPSQKGKIALVEGLAMAGKHTLCSPVLPDKPSSLSWCLITWRHGLLPTGGRRIVILQPMPR